MFRRCCSSIKKKEKRNKKKEIRNWRQWRNNRKQRPAMVLKINWETTENPITGCWKKWSCWCVVVSRCVIVIVISLSSSGQTLNINLFQILTYLLYFLYLGYNWFSSFLICIFSLFYVFMDAMRLENSDLYVWWQMWLIQLNAMNPTRDVFNSIWWIKHDEKILCPKYVLLDFIFFRNSSNMN